MTISSYFFISQISQVIPLKLLYSEMGLNICFLYLFLKHHVKSLLRRWKLIQLQNTFYRDESMNC